MDALFVLVTPEQWLFAGMVGLLAGFVKGAVGFAMPMILISGLSLFVSPELALAGLILPTLATNGWQALRGGVRSAWESTVRFKAFLLIGLVVLVMSAQLVRVIPVSALLMLVGCVITSFAVVQLLGLRLRLKEQTLASDLAVGTIAGFFGGLCGVWGPPTVLYLTALNTEKEEQVRAQGVIYGLGAVALLGAHIVSGVLQADTAPFSLFLVLPALFGMWLGNRVLARINQAQFRQLTLLVLLIVGLNLIRRALLS